MKRSNVVAHYISMDTHSTRSQIAWAQQMNMEHNGSSCRSLLAITSKTTEFLYCRYYTKVIQNRLTHCTRTKHQQTQMGLSSWCW